MSRPPSNKGAVEGGFQVPLVPPPRAHLVTYHGVLAPCASLCSAIVPAATARGPPEMFGG